MIPSSAKDNSSRRNQRKNREQKPGQSKYEKYININKKTRKKLFINNSPSAINYTFLERKKRL